MEVYDHIDAMKSRIIIGEDQSTCDHIILYSTGLCAKLKNAEYALSKIRELYNKSDSSILTSGFSNGDIFHFYLDSFFAFLYSAFDIIAQVINQKYRLRLNEDRVSFKSVERNLNQSHQNSAIYNHVRNTLNKRFFKALDKYRNFSTHRRQIYIQNRTTQVSGTPGYTTSAEITRIERIICDDPLVLVPTVNKNRELITYCSDILNKTLKENIKLTKVI